MVNYTFRASKRELSNWKNAYLSKDRKEKGEDILFQRIGLMDPSIGTSNMGDYIIQDAIKKNIRQIFPTSFVSTFPTQLSRKMDSVTLMQEQDIILIGGTNLLASNMDSRFQWKVTPRDTYFFPNKMVLFGTGWWQYQETPNNYTKNLFSGLLSKTFLHSVRDSYTKDKLKSIGIENVINTTCPTLWSIDEEACSAIPSKKASNVITTLTFYNKDHNKDSALIKLLQANYDLVYIWIQGFEDMGYLKEIAPDLERIITVNPDLHFYDEILATNEDIEYVGTRLHAGIRAIQHGKRSLIVAVDNRAFEISKDTNLNVIRREELEKCNAFIHNEYRTNIKLPEENITIWKNQFMK
ncbi:polysaccharide pyruvyl transferase family protein [Dyadobacter sp. CY356]|uniref:polysaccharide pyruvyl transferase family protein n=1 Tax=Dyadobacter sp. CY356 TaxID=2906442 RepID=UPI001F39ED4E|nr:polysaccharide pyruvyl transferase family protein [Dyadobacter sp. CY356]MCF0055163.1 polysaccharide pyruvyl transferase family protein [Dyadobacter sp. CY356]